MMKRKKGDDVVAEQQTIFFDAGSTDSVSKGLYDFGKKNRFSLLSLPTGHGKTAVAVKTVGLMADMLGKDVGIFLIAPKTKLQEKSWEYTIDQYRTFEKDNIYLAGSITPDSLGNANKYDTFKNDHWKAEAKKKNKKTVEKYMKKELAKGRRLLYEDAQKEAFYKKPPVTWQEVRDSKKSLKREYLPLFRDKDKPVCVVADEVHMFKNPKSNRGKAFQKIVRESKAYGLTATPMTNGLFQDGVGYLVYNGFYSSHSQCQKAHVSDRHLDRYFQPDIYLEDGSIDPNKFIDLDGFKNEISQTIYMPAVTIDFDIPEVETQVYQYSLDDSSSKSIQKFSKDYRQRKYDSHGAFLSDVRGAIGSDLEHRRSLVRILMAEEKAHKEKGSRLIQPLIFYSNNKELGDDPKEILIQMRQHYVKKGVELNKLQLKKLYKKILDSPKINKGILWSLAMMNKKYGIINGKNSRENLDVSDPDKVIVIQYKAGGAGIEFKESNLTIFYGVQYSWQDTEQAIGRNVRRGQDHIVKDYFLLSNSPYDQHIWQRLSNKREFTIRAKDELSSELSPEELATKKMELLEGAGMSDTMTAEEEEMFANEIADLYMEM